MLLKYKIYCHKLHLEDVIRFLNTLGIKLEYKPYRILTKYELCFKSYPDIFNEINNYIFELENRKGEKERMDKYFEDLFINSYKSKLTLFQRFINWIKIKHPKD